MLDVTQILTHTKNIAEQKQVTVSALVLSDEQVRLRIERFALMANNVTYAASGFAIGYWQFFLVPEDGCAPHGFAGGLRHLFSRGIGV